MLTGLLSHFQNVNSSTEMFHVTATDLVVRSLVVTVSILFLLQLFAHAFNTGFSFPIHIDRGILNKLWPASEQKSDKLQIGINYVSKIPLSKKLIDGAERVNIVIVINDTTPVLIKIKIKQ